MSNLPNISESTELPPLSEHELRVKQLLLSLSEAIQGFPETPRGLHNVTRAWAAFLSFTPYQVKLIPQVEELMSEQEKKKSHAMDGTIPAEWLMKQIRDGFEWLPAPVVAREIYCSRFSPADGVEMEKLSPLGRKRPARGDE